MAKKKQKATTASTKEAVSDQLPSTTRRLNSDRILIPTDSPRHMTAIRFGKVSGEIFCRKPKRREELGLLPLPTVD